jgi:hypothetical protein
MKSFSLNRLLTSFLAGFIWNIATEAAVVKASTQLTPGEVVVCSFILDWPKRVDKLGTYYTFPHKVGDGFGVGQTYSASLVVLMDCLNIQRHDEEENSPEQPHPPFV